MGFRVDLNLPCPGVSSSLTVPARPTGYSFDTPSACLLWSGRPEADHET